MQNLKIVTAVLIALFVAGCDESPFTGSSNNTASSPDTVVETPDLIENKSEEVVQVSASAQESFEKRIGALFESVLPKLDETRELLDAHRELPDNSLIPFTRDKQSNESEINQLLDEAIATLGVSEVSDYRERIHNANQAIVDAREKIANYRQKRVSASAGKDQSRLEKVNPFELSKEEIDQKIVHERERIKRQQEELVALKKSFANELAKIGVQVDEAGVESLLSSVSGDDIVTMAVVFDNIKHVTTQLQELTEESGEALETSKRYYGMYVVMVRVMDRIQKNFVEDIREKHIPKLREFAEQADENIADARRLIKARKGDSELLQGNIQSNQLTRETAELYVEYLERNAALVAAENKRAQSNIATAMNTYNTVKLSSDVAKLMKSGRRDFEAMMRLRVPSLREFGNDAIRKEFNRMTTELRAGT